MLEAQEGEVGAVDYVDGVDETHDAGDIGAGKINVIESAAYFLLVFLFLGKWGKVRNDGEQ